MRSIVVALGGNALLGPSGRQDFSLEGKNVNRVSKSIAELCRNRSLRLIITHGNGSQVGDEVMKNEHSRKFVPELPLYAVNAETQASIGTVVEISLRNALNRLKIRRDVSIVLAHVLVDSKDPAFKKPSKQIGPFYNRKELEEELRLDRFDYIKLGLKYRRVVASPKPKAILELDAINSGSGNGITITCGGGGIPMIKRKGTFEPVDAVIDKDLTTQLLASAIRADTMVILTNADCLYADYNHKKGAMREIPAGVLKKNLNRFEEGTIRPKIEACIKFIESGGKNAYIGNVFKLEQVLEGSSGTRVF